MFSTQTADKPLTKKRVILMLAASICTMVTSGYLFLESRNVKADVEKQLSTINRAIENQIQITNKVADSNTKLKEENVALEEENQRLREKLYEYEEASRGTGRTIDVVVTAYALSGTTATGFSLAGHNLYSARVIAVDPNVIPLGSQVRISFHDDNMKQFDGLYTASDTGGAIIGNKIDLFVGDGNVDLAYSIGIRTATVEIL